MADLEAITELFHLLSDPTRIRLLALVGERELSVAELTAATELAQSRVSTHLGKLREAGLVADRRAGTSTFYRMQLAALSEPQRRTWQLLRDQLDDAVLRQDAERAADAVAAREGGTSWYDQVAGRMERHYSPGRTWEAAARSFVGLMRLGHVLDVGSGDGAIASMLAPRSHAYTCLDRSARVLSAAAERLTQVERVRCVLGDMHRLPFGAERFDQLLLFNVLTYATEPQQVIREATRVLRPGGDLCLTTLDAHTHDAVTRNYQHVLPGFSPNQLERMLGQAGLRVERCAVTSREGRAPHFQVVTAFAQKAEG